MVVAVTVSSPHAHHWLIDSPAGLPTVEGRCHLCGERRSFSAAGDDRPLHVRHMASKRARRIEHGPETATTVPEVPLVRADAEEA